MRYILNFTTSKPYMNIANALTERILLIKKQTKPTGKMAQQLEAYTTLAENLSFLPAPILAGLQTPVTPVPENSASSYIL